MTNLIEMRIKAARLEEVRKDGYTLRSLIYLYERAIKDESMTFEKAQKLMEQIADYKRASERIEGYCNTQLNEIAEKYKELEK